MTNEGNVIVYLKNKMFFATEKSLLDSLPKQEVKNNGFLKFKNQFLSQRTASNLSSEALYKQI